MTGPQVWRCVTNHSVSGSSEECSSWQGRQIPETLPEIVDPVHTVVIMHDIQNDNTGPNGVFARDNRRIDVTHLLGRSPHSSTRRGRTA